MRITVVTSRPSRAWVHSDWSVYMALPSASRHSTWRSGHATAAPVATGRPWPMAPPVRQSQSWRGAPAVAPDTKIPEVFPSSLTMAPSGSRAPMAAARLWAFERAGGPLRARRRLHGRRRRRAPQRVGEGLERAGHVVGPGGEGVDLAASGTR